MKKFIFSFLLIVIFIGLEGLLMDLAGIWPSEYIVERDTMIKHAVCGILELLFVAVSGYIFAFKVRRTFEQVTLFFVFLAIAFFIFETVVVNVIRVGF